MTSAIGNEIKAGMLNMTEGAAHSVWNFFGNMSTDATEASNKNDLYKSSNTLMTYCYHLGEALTLIQMRICIILGFENFPDEIIKSQRILENVRKGYIAEDELLKNILEALPANPFNLETYTLCFEKFGDPFCGIRHLAVAVGLGDEVEAVKKNVFVERVDEELNSMTLFPGYSLSAMEKYGEDIDLSLGNLPSEEKIKADYKIIETAAEDLNINLYGTDTNSFVACCYRLLIRAFQSSHEDNGVPAFKYLNQNNLGDFVVPEGVETIGAFAFAGATLNSLKLPSTLKKIEAGAFFDSIIRNNVLEIPEGTEEISIDMLWNASCLFVHLPNSIKHVTGEPENFKFKRFKRLTRNNPKFYFDINRADMIKDYFSVNKLMKYTNIFTVAKLLSKSPSDTLDLDSEILFNGILSNAEVSKKIFGGKPFEVKMSGDFYRTSAAFIGFRGFAGSRVKKILWSDGLKVICDEAFFDCQDLQALTLPRSLEKLGARVFRQCKNLHTIVIPETVKEIGDDLLRDCPAVIYCDSKSPVAEYCRKNNLPMEDYGRSNLLEGRQTLRVAQTKKDLKRAERYFNEAAFVGNAEACYESGRCQLIEKKYLSAVEYFERAAENGHRAAMAELYKIYKSGITDAEGKLNIIAANADKAAKWLQRSGYNAEKLNTPTVQRVTNYAERALFTSNLRERFQNVSCLYFANSDSKADEKINKALKAYAHGEIYDFVICAFDNTFFGGADDGFLIASKNFYAHNSGSDDVIIVPIANIKSFSVADGNLFLNGNIKISISRGGKSAEDNIPVILNEIKRALAGR